MITAPRRPPLIYIPGFTSNRLEWQFENKKGVHRSLATFPKNKWKVSYMATSSILYYRRGFLEAHSVTYVTDDTGEPRVDEAGIPITTESKYPGCRIRASAFPSWEGVRQVDTLPTPDNAYHYHPHKRFENFLLAHGWVGDGVDLFVCSYDWRRAAWAQPNMNYDEPWKGTDFERMRRLIEHAHETNGQRVLLFAHSFGAMFAHLFLMEQDAAWVDAHVGAAFYCCPGMGGCSLATHQWAGVGCTRGPAPFTWARNMGDWPCFALLAVDDELAPRLPFARYDGRLWTASETEDLIAQIHAKDPLRLKLFRIFRRVAKRIWRTQPRIRTHMQVVHGVATTQIYDISPRHITQQSLERSERREARRVRDRMALVPVPIADGDGDLVVQYPPLRALIAYWQLVMGPRAAPAGTSIQGGPVLAVPEQNVSLSQLVQMSRLAGENVDSDEEPLPTEQCSVTYTTSLDSSVVGEEEQLVVSSVATGTGSGTSTPEELFDKTFNAPPGVVFSHHVITGGTTHEGILVNREQSERFLWPQLEGLIKECWPDQ